MTSTTSSAEKERGAGEIAPIERHGDGVAAGLAQRRGGDLDDPEAEGDFGNLARRRGDLGHRGPIRFCAGPPKWVLAWFLPPGALGSLDIKGCFGDFSRGFPAISVPHTVAEPKPRPHVDPMRARSDAAVRMLKTMFVASVAIPVAIFSYVSWITYHDAYTHADERLWASLGIMSEHTSRIVQLVDLTFAAVDAIAGNLTDEQIKAAKPRCTRS